jgi:hypothetical protein
VRQFGGVLFHYVPDYSFGHTVAPVLARAADTSEYPAGGQIGRGTPDIHGGLHPLWHRHGPDMPTLADEVDYGPVLFALLEMPEIQVSQFSPSEPASKQDRKDRSVSLTLYRIPVRRLPQPASPSAVSHFPSLTPSFLTLFTRRMPAANSGLSIDRSCGQLPVFKMDKVSGDYFLVER